MNFKELNQTLIPNTKMMQGIDDNGNVNVYRIYPNECYKMHDKLRDWEDINYDTDEKTLHKGYTGIMASCGADYDFESNPREFYAEAVV